MKQYLIAEETRDQLIDLLEGIDERWRKSPSTSASSIERAAMSILPNLRRSPEAPVAAVLNPEAEDVLALAIAGDDDMTQADMDRARDYIEALKAAGFEIVSNETLDSLGMEG